jgi:hypothetical protein
MRVIFCIAFLFACSESDDTAVDAGFTGTDAGRRDAGGGNDAGGGTDAGSFDAGEFDANFDAGAMPSGGLVINEITAAGDDWIELFNAGSSAVMLGGMRIADRDDATMMPRVERAVAIPAGVTLEPGGYFFVLADQTAASTMLETECLVPAITACIHTDWGISAGAGDTIYVLAPEGETVLQMETYPGATVMDMQSWARIPNGTGAFEAATPTPAAENAPL